MKIPYLLEMTAVSLIGLHTIAVEARDVATPYAQLSQASSTRITIGQAISIAEKEANGEAVEAELEKEDGRMVYDIDVLTPSGKMEVFIDPETGRVLSVHPDD